MRLIDGDALEKFLSDAEMEATERKKYVFAGALNVIQGNVRNFPTIEPERKKGKWTYRDGKPATIGKSYSVVCSECNEWSEYCTNYCPNCGAMMVQEVEE